MEGGNAMKPAVFLYGVPGQYGNYAAALEAAGARVVLCRDLYRSLDCDGLLLPGGGDIRGPLPGTETVLVDSFVRSRRPILGICRGMQLLFDKSYEYGEHKGLGLIGGEVVPLGPYLADPALKVPHMGWNALNLCRPQDPLFRYISEGECVYYVHSFYARNCRESTLATSEYGIAVTGAVKNGLVYGTQFHPEKSGETGLRLLKAFAEM